MKNIFPLIVLLAITIHSSGQSVARVDKKTKEFIIPSDTKTDFSIIGYQFPNPGTKKMICFSNNSSLVMENNHDCPLGAYFDTNHLKLGDMVYYLGTAGSYAKMNMVQGNGKKTVFYILKNSFVIK